MAKKENVCENCESYAKCVNTACENKVIRCVNFGELLKSMIDTIEKVNNIPHEYLCTSEELKTLSK